MAKNADDIVVFGKKFNSQDKPPMSKCSIEFTGEQRGEPVFKRTLPPAEDIYTEKGAEALSQLGPFGRSQIDRILDIAKTHFKSPR